ncbi:MAG: LptF/LptG family permease [Litoreibacter sp.]
MDRYLITESFWLFVGFLVLACSILLIERLVRLTEIVSNADNPAFDAVRLMTRLLPHYLELTLPCALLLTTIMTVNRLSRNGEITAILSSGVSLYRVARPFVAASFVLAVLSLLSSGYLNPMTRYNFRAVVHEIGQDNIVSAFQDQRFMHFDEWTVWTEGIDPKTNTLGETFILESREDGSERVLFGSSGALFQSPEGSWVIRLNDAMLGDIPQTFATERADQARARQIDLEMPGTGSEFRSRGMDERELTLIELFNKSYMTSDFDIDPAIAAAELHDRIVRALMLVSLTLIGVVLGLNLQRNPRSGGVILGILLFLGVQKFLEFGLLEAQQQAIPAWAGSWPVLFGVTALAFLLLHRANGPFAPRIRLFARGVKDNKQEHARV